MQPAPCCSCDPLYWSETDCALYYYTLTGYLLLIRQLIPHASQESCEFAVRKVWPLLMQFGTFLLREDKHG